MKNAPEHILSGISIILSLISCLLLFMIVNPFPLLVTGVASFIMCIIDVCKTREWCILNIIGIILAVLILIISVVLCVDILLFVKAWYDDMHNQNNVISNGF